MAAMPQTRAELNSVIELQVRIAIGPPQIASIWKLADHFVKFDELASSFIQVQSELQVIKTQLEGVLPQFERTSQASIADLEKRAGIANAQLNASIEALEKRDQEMSAKLKTNFEQIDTQMESVQLQAATVTSIQEGCTEWLLSSSMTWKRCVRMLRGTWRMPWQPSRPTHLTRVRAGIHFSRATAEVPN